MKKFPSFEPVGLTKYLGEEGKIFFVFIYKNLKKENQVMKNAPFVIFIVLQKILYMI